MAFHLHANEIPTVLITRLGKDDLGAQAEQALRALGMDLRGLQWDDALPTGRVGIEVVQSEARYTLHPGAWQALRCDPGAKSLLARCKVFCFGTLSQESAPGLSSWREALSQLPETCVRVCDPNLRGSRIDAELVYQHLLAADIVKINDEEAAVMAKTYGQPDLSSWLLGEMKVKTIALTHGVRGATLISQGSQENHPGFSMGPVDGNLDRDNIGAGDSFTALLIRAHLAGASKRATLEAANRYAAFVASRRGATPRAPAALLAQLRELMISE